MKVEIWSDVVCPWCHIGKRRFEAALQRFAHREQVEVLWRSFELDPSAPADPGTAMTDHLAAKYGVARADAVAMQERVRAVGASEGLDLRLSRARRGNSFDAHRLLHLAAERGVQARAVERFATAYLSEGQLLSDHETLTRLAVEAGLGTEDVAGVLAGEDHAGAVRADEAEARALGISGVPFFVLDRAYGVSGAQPAEVLLEALERAWAAGHPRHRVEAQGTSGCTDDGCGPSSRA